MAALGRTLPLDFIPANSRNRCSPLIDRRHAKVWISMSQLPLTYPGASRASNSTQTVIRPQCQRSQPPGRARPSHHQTAHHLGLQLDLLGYGKRVVYLDAEIAHSAFQLRVPEQS